LTSSSGSPRGRGSDSVQSVSRALRLVQILARGGGELPLSEIAATAGLPVATTHRLLQSLTDQGFACRTGSRQYALGPSLISLGRQAQTVFTAWAEPVLLAIADKAQETTSLSILDNDEVLYIAQAQSKQTIRVVRLPGTRMGLHHTAAGKAILAQLTDERVREITARTGMPRRTPFTLSSVDELLGQVRLTRLHGWAVDDQESEVGIRCVGAPAGSGMAAMAISVSGPPTRMTDAKCEEIGCLLTSVTGSLARPGDAARGAGGKA
jgi:IclR family acetate operon transcriptional repressor